MAQLLATALSAKVMTFVAAVVLLVARATAAEANKLKASVAMKFASSAVANAKAFPGVQCATAWIDSARSERLSAVAPIATTPMPAAEATASLARAPLVR